jgi:ABC-type antimicrobial peptide transport system permease subunit
MSHMRSQKRNYVIEFEEKLLKLFRLKQKYVLQNTLEQLIPNNILSASLRKDFQIMVQPNCSLFGFNLMIYYLK